MSGVFNLTDASPVFYTMVLYFIPEHFISFYNYFFFLLDLVLPAFGYCLRHFGNC